MKWVQLCASLNILWHCLSLGLEWKLTLSIPVASAEFSKCAGSKFADILSTFTGSSLRIWKSSAGIASPPLALFVVMLPKTHLTLHSRMSSYRYVITIVVIWIMKMFFVYLFCVFLPSLLNIFCVCYVHTISVLYRAHLCMKCSLGSSNFIEENSSLSHSMRVEENKQTSK